jgi:hypothetical protein
VRGPYPYLALDAVSTQIEYGLFTAEAGVKVRQLVLLLIEPVHVDHNPEELRYAGQDRLLVLLANSPETRRQTFWTF